MPLWWMSQRQLYFVNSETLHKIFLSCEKYDFAIFSKLERLPLSVTSKDPY